MNTNTTSTAMNIKKLLALGSVVLALAGCSDYDHPLPDVNTGLADGRLASALERAEAMINDLEPDGTRSRSRVIKSLEKFSSPTATRAGTENEIYIVSYEGDGGFAIVNITDTVMPVLAFSNEGSMCIADTAENPGLGIYLKAAGMPQLPDSLSWGSVVDPEIKPFQPIRPSYGEVVVAPILTGSVATWGQRYPFNSKLPLYNGHLPFTGCTATACGMILTHYSWPEQYNGVTFHWEDMRQSTYADDIPQLMVELNRDFNLNTQYEAEGSSAHTKDIPQTFNNMGYELPRIESLWNICSSTLAAGNPVLVVGSNTNSNKGHVWVIDGEYVYHHSPDLLADSDGKYVHVSYEHTVWGWDGSNNGYYRYSDTIESQPGYLESYEHSSTLPYIYKNFRAIGSLKKRTNYKP